MAFPICLPCALTQDTQEALMQAQELNVTAEHMNMARDICRQKGWGTHQNQKLISYIALNIMVRETQDRTSDTL